MSLDNTSVNRSGISAVDRFLLLEMIYVVIIHLQFFSYLRLILFLSYILLQILICLIVYLLVELSLLDNMPSFIMLLPFLEKNLISLL